MFTRTLGKKLLWVLAVVGMLLLGGCIDAPTQPAAKTFIGVVADGYLQGVIVFLDKNDNKTLDSDEPCAVTDASGTYVLTNVTLADLLTYPIVVRVLATAVDRGTGKAVGKEYILSAPPGKPWFVSPMTTLVHNLMQANPALGVDAAEAAIKGQIGVSSISLFGDYLRDAATSSVTSRESQLVHNVARVVVAAMGTSMEAVKTELGGSISTADLSAVISIVNLKVARQLPAIAAQVPLTSMSDAAVADIAATLENIDVTTIRRQIDARVPAVAGSYKGAVQGDGFCRVDKTSGTYPYQYATFQLGDMVSSGVYPLEQAVLNYIYGGWFSELDSTVWYELAASGWVPVPGGPSQGTVQFAGDGTATFTDAATGKDQGFTVSALDVSGKEIAPYAAQGGIAVDPSALFPAGSYAYEMTFTPRQDTYRLSADTNLSVPSVSSLLSTYSNTSGKYLKVWNRTTVQFAGNGTTGTVKFYVDQQLSSQTGSWELRNVAGQQILLIKAPFAYKSLSDDLTIGDDRVYGMVEGGVREGRMEYAGVPHLQWSYAFSRNATDVILQNFIP